MNEIFNTIITQLTVKNYDSVITLCNNHLKLSKHPQIYLFLAIAYGEIGNIAEANKIFNNLVVYFPKNANIFYNYGVICQKNHLNDKALELYNSSLQHDPQNASAWNNKGEIYRTNNQLKEAIDAFAHALAIKNNIYYRRNLGISYYQANEFEKATRFLFTLVGSSEFNEEVCSALLDSLISLRQLKRATKIGLMALKLFPNNLEILNLVGLCELEKRKFLPATNYFKQALQLDENNFNVLSHLASSYIFSAKHAKALELLDKIAKFNTQESWVFVCLMYETTNQSALLATAIAEGLQNYPQNPELHLFKAKLLKTQKHYKQSSKAINTALQNNDSQQLKASILYEKAQVLDKRQHFSKAWKVFKKAGILNLKNWHKYSPNKDLFNISCKQITKSFHTVEAKKKPSKGDLNGENLIFIVGFPRSGTTLLDSILSAHTKITVLEEAPVIGETYDQIKNMTPKHYAKILSKLKDKKLNKLREFYFSALKNYSNWNQQGILVDKSPLNTVHVGFIHTLFPQAKIIFAQRHPLDVCLSCFFQDFKMNSFMTNLTSMNKAAKTYHSMLSVWKTSIEKFEIPVYYQSYEKLVSNFDSQIKALFCYLDLPWQEQVINFQKELSKRGAIATPSYNQVSQPIYRTSKYRYLNYQSYLKKPTKTLTAWIEYFNYPKIITENH